MMAPIRIVVDKASVTMMLRGSGLTIRKPRYEAFRSPPNAEDRPCRYSESTSCVEFFAKEMEPCTKSLVWMKTFYIVS